MAGCDRRRDAERLAVHRSRRRRLSDVDLTLTEAAYEHVRSAYVEGNDGELPTMRFDVVRATLPLPSVLKDGLRHDVQEFVNSSLLDCYHTSTLEQTKVINWTPFSAKLVCLNTEGDGNCLMHGASLAMWGIQDRNLLLRRAVHTALRRDPQGCLRQRWRRARETADSEMDFSLRLEDNQWETEWRRHVVELSSCREKTAGLRYESLEEFHVFVLAQVLCRPIIVLAEKSLRSVGGEPLSPVNIAGIYLPLERRVIDCVRSPIVLGYSGGHYSALTVLSGDRIVPLCFHTMERLPTRFLLEGEERNTERLLEQYLDKVVQSLPPPNPTVSFMPVDAVRIAASSERPRMLSALGETYEQQLDTLFLEDQAAKCRTAGCKNYHVGTSEFCSSCSRKNGRPGLETQRSGESARCQGTVNMQPCFNVVESGSHLCRACRERNWSSSPQSAGISGRRSPGEELVKKCTTETCNYHGAPEFSGMCSACFKIYTMQQAKAEQHKQGSSSNMITQPPPERRCLHEGCTRPASEEVLSFCYEHYIERSSARANKRAEAQSSGSGPVRTGTTLLQLSGAGADSSRQERCRTPGCSHTNLEWRGFCEVCLQSMSEAWLLQRRAAANICQPPSSPSTGGAAHPFNSRLGVQSAELSGPAIRQCTRCKDPLPAGCNIPGGYCQGCFYNVGVQVDCKTPGCSFTGSAECDWYCSQCHSRRVREREALRIRDQQNAALRDVQRMQQPNAYGSSAQAAPPYAYLQVCAMCTKRSTTLAESGICNTCAQEGIRVEGMRHQGMAGFAAH